MLSLMVQYREIRMKWGSDQAFKQHLSFKDSAVLISPIAQVGEIEAGRREEQEDVKKKRATNSRCVSSSIGI